MSDVMKQAVKGGVPLEYRKDERTERGNRRVSRDTSKATGKPASRADLEKLVLHHAIRTGRV